MHSICVWFKNKYKESHHLTIIQVSKQDNEAFLKGSLYVSLIITHSLPRAHSCLIIIW